MPRIKVTYRQWTSEEEAKLVKMWKAGICMSDIAICFPARNIQAVREKLWRLKPAARETTFVMRAERNLDEEPLSPINYGTIRIEVIEIAKNKLGDRVTEINGTYYLDGKRCLVQDLIGASKK